LHVVSRKKLREAAAKHSGLESALETWFRVAKSAEWKSIADVRRTYPSADPVDRFTVFNIKGGGYRLIAKIEYRYRKVFIKHVLTHEEYDRGGWK
jgi:mRNA interferase HigB